MLIAVYVSVYSAYQQSMGLLTRQLSHSHKVFRRKHIKIRRGSIVQHSRNTVRVVTMAKTHSMLYMFGDEDATEFHEDVVGVRKICSALLGLGDCHAIRFWLRH